MRISDWSSDVCSSDLEVAARIDAARQTSEEDTGTFSVATAFRVIREDALQIRQATGDDETRIGLDERRPLRVELGTADTCTRRILQLCNATAEHRDELHLHIVNLVLERRRIETQRAVHERRFETDFARPAGLRSEEHTAELHSLLRT